MVRLGNLVFQAFKNYLGPNWCQGCIPGEREPVLISIGKIPVSRGLLCWLTHGLLSKIHGSYMYCEVNSRNFYFILASSSTDHTGLIEYRFFFFLSFYLSNFNISLLPSELYIFAIKSFHLLDGCCVNSNFVDTQLYCLHEILVTPLGTACLGNEDVSSFSE